MLLFSLDKDLQLTRSPDLSTQPDVLCFPCDTVAATHRMDAGHVQHGSIHAFEKPVALCRRLIETLTRTGDLVVEPFGCTGPASVAAIESGRQYVYIESNSTNFKLGIDRIHRAEMLRSGTPGVNTATIEDLLKQLEDRGLTKQALEILQRIKKESQNTRL
jgi:hypothetical protein